MFRRVMIFILLSSSPLYLFAEDYTVASEVLWPESKLVIDIVYPLPVTERPLPAEKKQIEEEISDALPVIIFNELSGMILDSHTRVKDYLNGKTSVIPRVFKLADKAAREISIFSRDMKNLEIRYTVSLYPDIAEIFLPAPPHEELGRLLKFVPSADFTGIVIYIDRQKGFTPSLFPRIYDQNMNLIMDRFHIDSDMIKKWGAVQYRQNLDLAGSVERIGHSPLKLAARGLFGVNNTDIIISTLDAEKILSRKKNINLIYQGRILIVYERSTR